jgi:hypothetical protein
MQPSRVPFSQANSRTNHNPGVNNTPRKGRPVERCTAQSASLAGLRWRDRSISPAVDFDAIRESNRAAGTATTNRITDSTSDPSPKDPAKISGSNWSEFQDICIQNGLNSVHSGCRHVSTGRLELDFPVAIVSQCEPNTPQAPCNLFR